MGQSSSRDDRSNSHKIAASTYSPYDEDMEETEEDETEEDEKPDPHRVEMSELVEGDHIYKWSASTAYAHHGIYYGHNLVIHFVHLTGGSSSSASFSTPGLSGLSSKISKGSSSGPSSVPRLSGMSSYGSVLAGCYLKNNSSPHGRELLPCLNNIDCGKRKIGSGVVLNCLNCFLRRKKYSLCRYEYGVSQSTFEREVRGGTCTTAESGKPKEVIHRAMHLHDNGFGNYDLEKHNCEDFALYCKTGLLVPNKSAPPTSNQINYLLDLASFSSTEETRTGTITTNGSNMYFRDIGVRNDVERVAVENVAAFLKRRDGPA